MPLRKRDSLQSKTHAKEPWINFKLSGVRSRMRKQYETRDSR